jgi:septum formation protein
MATRTEKTDIVLASASPRRRALLKRIVPEFRIEPSRADEASITERDPVTFALAAAVLKAREVGKRFRSSLIIAADTVVALDGRIFGKPANRGDARKTLMELSGRKHRVITAVAFYCYRGHRLLARLETSFVRFRKLDGPVIEAYLDTGSYADKAGSYAIQEVGDSFVEALEGDFDNVVGLPVDLVKKMYAAFTSAYSRPHNVA